MASSIEKNWRLLYRPGPLGEKELEQYWTEGFVVLPSLLSIDKLEAAKRAVGRLVDNVAQQLFKAGKIKDLYEEADLSSRLTLLEAQFPGASVLVHKQGILPPEFAALWCCPELLQAASQIIGDDIGGHPVWNLRCKTPQNEESTVPWHQDNAYLASECWQCLQLTAWIPLVDATCHNGCMQVLRRGHQSGRTAKHTCCVGGTWYVEMDEADAAQQLGINLTEDCVTCEVPFGGALLLNNLIPHRSLSNKSQQIRWSLDLRFQRLKEPNGFYGLKPCIALRKQDEPHLTIDWSTWANLDRNTLQSDAISTDTKAQAGLLAQSDDEDMDTTISGPWFDNWDLVHHNRHTKAYQTTSKHSAKDWTFA